MDILAGFMEKAGDTFYITHGIFRRDGTRDYYRKTQLGKSEKLFFASGDTLEVFFLTNWLKIGIPLCVETHYPEITQALALKGAAVIFAPHAVPRASGDRQSGEKISRPEATITASAGHAAICGMQTASAAVVW